MSERVEHVERAGRVGRVGTWKIGKQRLAIGQVVPLYGAGLLEKAAGGGGSQGSDADPFDVDIDWSEYSDEPTHRHFGHPDDHPVRLRHRKTSTDHLHADEDKLVDKYKELASKARGGQCTPEEVQTLKATRGQMLELNSRRSADARRVYLGEEMKKGEGPVQGSPAAQFTSYSGRVRHQ